MRPCAHSLSDVGSVTVIPLAWDTHPSQEDLVAQQIWQATDHRPVTAAEAHREWALRAHEVLAEVAGRYGRSIGYSDLGGEVQRRAGILTDMDPDTWLDDVLADVGNRCSESGKPSLTALVDVPYARSRQNSDARLACYQAYGAKVPNERAPRTPGTRATRKPAAKRPVKLEDRVRPICPTCFVELPGTGVCDTCD